MGKDITETIADLRLDLKDTGALWSNAELTRSVEKAVADLSRFLPLERSYEVTVDVEVDDESFTTLVAADPDLIVDNMNISAVVDGGTATLTGSQPDAPRPVIVTLTDTGGEITAFRLIVRGYDKDSNYITENFYLSGGTLAAGVRTWTGQRHFAHILEIEFDEIADNGAGDVLDVGTGSPTGIWIELANKPIKKDSAVITGFALDTAYIMDYAGGRIALKSGGTMVANTAYTVSYEKSAIHIDLSSLKDFIRVERVEYPSGQIPQAFANKELWNMVLTITSEGLNTQKETTDAEHVTIRYYARHSPPAASTPGSYPDFLDTTVELAASAYALFTKALAYEHQAVLDFATARLALIKIATYLETNANHSAKLLLEDITTALHSGVVTMAGHADAVLSQLTSALTVVKTDLAAIYTEQKKFLIATSGYTDIEAETFLEAGDDHINAVGLGSRVAENYREYAEASIRMADIAGQEGNWLASLAYAESSMSNAIANSMSAVASSLNSAAAAARVLVDNNRSYIEESAAWTAIARGFAEEGTSYIAIAQANLALAERFRAEAVERRNEAWAIWKDAPQFSPMYTMTTVRQVVS